MDMRSILQATAVMPVLTVQDATTAGDLALALVEGGITVFEVLLRTPAAIAGLAAMVRAAPQAHIGAGTLLHRDDVLRAVDAGAHFGVSPALTPGLATAVHEARLPFLPGVNTPSEVLAAWDLGFDTQKLFPAQGAQGVAWLQAIGPVFPLVHFCPTGGIRAADVPTYLALSNCIAVGGSWVAPPDLVQRRDWKAITALARQASAMRPA